MQDTLTGEGWDRLRASLPDMAQFQRMVGVKRGYGQAPHNRGILHYWDGMEVAGPWKEFIAELHGKAYDSFLRRMLALRDNRQIILTGWGKAKKMRANRLRAGYSGKNAGSH